MGDITREEFDGLGKRVSTVREDFVTCRAHNKARAESTEAQMVDVKADIGILFGKVDALSEKVGALTVKVATAVALVSIAIQIIMRYLPNLSVAH